MILKACLYLIIKILNRIPLNAMLKLIVLWVITVLVKPIFLMPYTIALEKVILILLHHKI